MTFRDLDLDVSRPFAKTLETRTRQRLADRMTLRRLAQQNVHDMIRALSGLTPPTLLVNAVYAGTEGNPFYAEEVFHHLAEEGRLFADDGQFRSDLQLEDLDVPEGVRLVIGRRLERLRPETRRVLTTAAIVGRSFNLRLLEAVGETEEDNILTAIEEAEHARLIVTMPSRREARWEFAHGLIRQTLEESRSLPRRQRAHLRVAKAMEAVFGTAADRHVPDLAHHLYQAGALVAPEKTIHVLTLAGAQALEAVALDEARTHYHRAIQLLDDVEDGSEHGPLRADLVLKWAEVSHYAATPENIATLETALSSAHALGDRPRAARLTYWLGRLNYMMGKPAEAAAQLSRSIELAETIKDEDALALSYNFRGRVCYQTAEYALGLDYLRKGIPMMERLGNRDESAYSESILGATLGWVGQFAEAFERHASALEVYRELGSDVGESAALNRLGMTQALYGSWTEAQATSTMAADTAQTLGNTLVVGMATATNGYAESMNGDVTAGIERLRDGIRTIESSGSTLVLSLLYAWLAEACARGGRAGVAREYATTSLKFTSAGDRWGEVAARRALGVSMAQPETRAWVDVERTLAESIELAR